MQYEKRFTTHTKFSLICSLLTRGYRSGITGVLLSSSAITLSRPHAQPLVPPAADPLTAAITDEHVSRQFKERHAKAASSARIIEQIHNGIGEQAILV